MKDNVLIIYAFPEVSDFSREYMFKYEQGAIESGRKVKLIDLSLLQFDPVLWGGYNSTQAMEEDLIESQNEIKTADHIVFFYPLWWSGMPALLKGFLERTFLPGFAFNFNKGGKTEKLLTGKSAHIVVTMHSSPDQHIAKMWAAGEKILKEGILQFCGIDPVKVTYIGPIYNSDDLQRNQWLEEAFNSGKLV